MKCPRCQSKGTGEIQGAVWEQLSHPSVGTVSLKRRRSSVKSPHSPQPHESPRGLSHEQGYGQRGHIQVTSTGSHLWPRKEKSKVANGSCFPRGEIRTPKHDGRAVFDLIIPLKKFLIPLSSGSPTYRSSAFAPPPQPHRAIVPLMPCLVSVPTRSSRSPPP